MSPETLKLADELALLVKEHVAARVGEVTRALLPRLDAQAARIEALEAKVAQLEGEAEAKADQGARGLRAV